MSAGGVHWAEWILPAVGALHTAGNSIIQGTGHSKFKAVSPGSSLDKAQTLGEQRQAERDQAAAAAEEEKKKQALAEVEARPDNVRRRAANASAALGETGKRASAYLSGV